MNNWPSIYLNIQYLKALSTPPYSQLGFMLGMYGCRYGNILWPLKPLCSRTYQSGSSSKQHSKLVFAKWYTLLQMQWLSHTHLAVGSGFTRDEADQNMQKQRFKLEINSCLGEWTVQLCSLGKCLHSYRFCLVAYQLTEAWALTWAIFPVTASYNLYVVSQVKNTHCLESVLV